MPGDGSSMNCEWVRTSDMTVTLITYVFYMFVLRKTFISIVTIISSLFSILFVIILINYLCTVPSKTYATGS